MISLAAGAIDVDLGKNEFFENFADLFQLGDESFGEYYYVGKDDRRIVESKRCLRRNLRRMRPRLDLLGYSLKACEAKLAAWLHDDEAPPASMDAFKHALRSLDWRERPPDWRKHIYLDEAIREAYVKAPGSGYPPNFEDGAYIAFERPLDARLVLRMLADMPEFQDLDVCWNFDDVLEGGYVAADTFVPDGPGSKRLVVTEGSSDAFVLQRVLQATHPDVADFFDFIDMREGNPFPGVGNLVSFCRGLARIGAGGHVLVALDNDAAGRDALRQLKALPMPAGFIATTLPDLDELRQVRTLGPAGEAIENINGRAAALECFLDFKGREEPPVVRWTTYIKALGEYQGELVAKDDYVADFKARFGIDPAYDISKLRRLWDHLITQCVATQ